MTIIIVLNKYMLLKVLILSYYVLSFLKMH